MNDAELMSQIRDLYSHPTQLDMMLTALQHVYYRGRGYTNTVVNLTAFFAMHPRGKVIVPDLATLDKLVALGIQPGQILLDSEVWP